MIFTCFLAIFLAVLGAVWFWRSSQSQNGTVALQYADQKLPFVSMPNLLIQTYFGRHRELIEFEAVKKHGKVFGTNIFGTKTIFVAEPELMQLIMNREFTKFTNRRNFRNPDPIIGSSLSLAQNETWKRLQSIVTPMFSSGSLKRMQPRIDDAVDTLLSQIAAKLKMSPTIDVKETVGVFVMDVILQTAFGTKVDSLYEPGNKIVANVESLFAKDISFLSTLYFICVFYFPKLLPFLRRVIPRGDEELTDFFKEFSLKLVREKKLELENLNAKQKANNFLEMLLEAEQEFEKLDKTATAEKPVKFMTKDELTAQCVLFFFAAHTTTAATIGLTLYNLALYPAIQSRLYDEIVANVETLTRDQADCSDPIKLITFENLSTFHYLSAVIDETLRLFPPNSTTRAASEDILLTTTNGEISLDIRKGDIIHFPVYTIHRDAEQFPDPETFNPDRFLGKPTFHKNAFLPFGQGPRNCVARSLALFEAKLAIINIVYRYRLSTCPQTAIPMQFFNNIQILTPKEIRLEMTSRSFD